VPIGGEVGHDEVQGCSVLPYERAGSRKASLGES
jgi:hypothetical protein